MLRWLRESDAEHITVRGGLLLIGSVWFMVACCHTVVDRWLGVPGVSAVLVNAATIPFLVGFPALGYGFLRTRRQTNR